MNHMRSLRAIVLAVLVMQVLSLPMPVAASAGKPPTVPEVIAVPAGSVLLFRSHAKGVQIYECQNRQWAFHAPRAVLFNPRTHRPTATHYGGIDRGLPLGPWWDSLRDSSRIRAGNAISAPSPNANSIPLLRLEVLERQGTGMFSPVRYIQRLNTTGGVGPTGACQTGAQRQVVYTADYYFYATS
jgi:hypothetical protein